LIVRHAEIKDLSNLVRLTRRLHEGSDWKWVPFSPAMLRRNLTSMIRKPDFCVLVAEHEGELTGLLYGTVDQMLYSKTLFATDMEFAAERGGGELLDAFRDWAKQVGAKVLIMGVSDSGRESAKDRFFSKHGLTRTGGLYQEVLQ